MGFATLSQCELASHTKVLMPPQLVQVDGCVSCNEVEKKFKSLNKN